MKRALINSTEATKSQKSKQTRKHYLISQARKTDRERTSSGRLAKKILGEKNRKEKKSNRTVRLEL